ncbi:hypothetical protein MMC22_006097 [Lobaria immixta]|nr:hypothetical protein [Lobaria immixta]
MSTSSLKTELLVPVPLILPSIQTRRAACTHLTMERLYGPYTCSVCQRPSHFLGWLYSCTQDDHQSVTGDNGQAMTAGMNVDEIHDYLKPDKTIKERPPSTTSLNPWVEKAILEGHYTAEQVATLRAQRQKVVDAISAAEDFIRKHPENASNGLTSVSAITSPSIDASTLLPNPPTAGVQDGKKLKPPPAAAGPQLKPSMFPFCKLRYCQACRPTFRDRTWIKFDDVFAKDSSTPAIDFEHDNRPISRVDLTCKLGLRERRRSRIPSFDSARRYSVNLTRQLLSNRRHSANLTGPYESLDEGTESESKGFRDGMKRAFRGMLMHRRGDSTSTRSSRKGWGKWEDVEFDMGLWRDLNDELILEASSVPLPGHDGMDGLGAEEGEMEVEEGVAVTEEGVDLGTADIIMSV